ncbi:MAG TPA: nuclear transport factor 2 family protein, partial [Blastocatellia bacterium]|nr:nuclear transport factor 2 family protein [Blastocatellia bacterium]
MKRMIASICLLLLTFILVLGQGGNRSSNEQELLKARREWYDAYHRRDAAALARIETADFAVISGSNISNKRQYENFERAAKENRVMPRGTEIVDDEGLRVRWQGDMAIISGSRWTKIPGQVEMPPQNKTAATEIWVKRDGRWRVMHLHYHQLQPPSSAGQGSQNQSVVEQPDAKLAQELMALNQTWREARKRGDTEAMSRLMAEEWTATNSDGLIITKERELAGAKAGN